MGMLMKCIMKLRFRACFLKLFLRIILVFFENCSCSLNSKCNLYVFFRTKEKKKKGIKRSFFFVLVFQNKNQFSKTINKQTVCF